MVPDCRGVAFLAGLRVHIRIAGVDGNVIKRWRRTQIVTCLRFQPGIWRVLPRVQ